MKAVLMIALVIGFILGCTLAAKAEAPASDWKSQAKPVSTHASKKKADMKKAPMKTAAVKKTATKAAASAAAPAPAKNLSRDVRFNGSQVDGKYLSAGESIAEVEGDKDMGALIGIRKNFHDRSNTEMARLERGN